MTKLPVPPKPEEQIRPDALVRTIKKEKPPEGERLKNIKVSPETYKRFSSHSKSRFGAGLPRGIMWGVAGLVALFVVGSIISYVVVKNKLKQSLVTQAGTLAAGVADLQNFEPQSAQQEFAVLTAGSSTPSFESVLGMFGSLFSGGQNAVSSFQDLASQLAGLSQASNDLENNLFSMVAGGVIGNGSSTSTVGSNASGTSAGLVADLTAIRDRLTAVNADGSRLSTVLGAMGEGSSSTLGSASDSYLPLESQLQGAQNFLDAFVPWLSSPTPHHVLVLLENPSEMRPGGGFMGSYADVTIASGTIASVSVRDIADVDAGFPVKIVPPPPLQLEMTGWRPADTNWFFDFPTSASKTLQLFSESKLYAGSTTFDGVVAISPKLISDLLSVTGPITISSTTFTSDNLLVQVQNIVQQGQAGGSSSGLAQSTYPKAIIGNLSHQIFTQLASSTDAQRQELFAMVLDWVAKRDVEAYFTDPAFENFITSAGAAGDVYALPQDFNGDYLAIVDANIRGDKSDLYVKQNVTWDATINADGTITDNVTIDRTHTGNQSPYWWYQTTSQDYLQLFVPDASSLTNETGGLTKTITPPINYMRSGYSTDPTIAAIASTTQSLFIYPTVATHEEDGKEVFATWSRVAAGNTTELFFDYSHRAYVPPTAGTQYQFVFEKQPGSVRSYDFTFDAPLGYVFAENNIASYEYTSDDPPGRLIITLTLKKL
jgi:hypothetical protein